MSVNHGFKSRVDFAAKTISSGHRPTRTFDSCFENFDGDVVATALYRRANKRPDTKLAQNLWNYLCQESVTQVAEENTNTDLVEWSNSLVGKGRSKYYDVPT